MNIWTALIVCATLVIVGLALTGWANGLSNTYETTSLKGIDGVKSVKNDLQVMQPFTREVINDKHEAIALRGQAAPCQDRFN
jgi:hypothetical protein